MATIKGPLKQVEIAQDGSSVKVRLADGSALQLVAADYVHLVSRLVEGMTAMRLNADSADPSARPNRHEPSPPMLVVDDFRLTACDEGSFLLDAVSRDRQRRTVLMLRPDHLRALVRMHAAAIGRSDTSPGGLLPH